MLPPNEAPKEFSIATATRPIPRPGNGGEVYLQIGWWMLAICFFFFLNICRVSKNFFNVGKRPFKVSYISFTNICYYRFLSQSVEWNSHTIRCTIITAWSGLVRSSDVIRDLGTVVKLTHLLVRIWVWTYTINIWYILFGNAYICTTLAAISNFKVSDLLALSAHVAVRNAAKLLHPRASRKEKQTRHKWKTEIQILRLRWI